MNDPRLEEDWRISTQLPPSASQHQAWQYDWVGVFTPYLLLAVAWVAGMHAHASQPASCALTHLGRARRKLVYRCRWDLIDAAVPCRILFRKSSWMYSGGKGRRVRSAEGAFV